jgi:serine/threonine protein kinase
MIGQTISHYKILEKLGEGGMGVVYKAEDIQLKRTVALKFLPDRVNNDTMAKERFLQEAQAAAALNHPNICTIHGVEDVDGSLFIVMEYIEGGTLREKLPFAKIDAAITIAAQIGESLHEAHSKGIVHRDIKADNIMLTSKGQAKVMDFGLAKLKGSLKLTKTSSTVGTLAYMAPEQIQGEEVDARSDIFSFGVLLFEMLTGHLPFRGEHDAAMMYSIVNEQPDPIGKYLPEASSEFLHIFNRALEKNPEDRYQSVQEMVIDLRRSKKETAHVSKAFAVSSADLSSMPQKTRPWLRSKAGYTVGAVTVLAVAALLFFWPRSTGELNPDRKTTPLDLSLTEIGYAGLSPDGNFLAFPAVDLNGTLDIYTMHTSGGDPKRITSDSSRPYRGSSYAASISPDSRLVAYSRPAPRDKRNQGCVVPVLGDTPPIVVADTGHSLQWRPDGKRLGFIILPGENIRNKLEFWTVSPEGTERKLEFTDTAGLGGRFSFAWSPDGESIAWLRTYADDYQEIIVHALPSGRERTLTFDKKHIDEVWWAANEQILYSTNKAGSTNIWAVPSSGGKPVQITTGEGPDCGITLSYDCKKLVYSRIRTIGHLWRALTDGSDAKRLTDDSRLNVRPSFSPNRKQVVFSSKSDELSTNFAIRIMDRDGQNSSQLVPPDANNNSPTWSPDGKWIAYTAYSAAAPDSSTMYIINPAERQPKRLPGFGQVRRWIDPNILVIRRGIRYWELNVHSGEQKPIFEDSTFAVPVMKGKYICYSDHRSNHRGIWLIQNSSGLEHVEPKLLATPEEEAGYTIFTASETSILLTDDSGVMQKVLFPMGSRERIRGTFPALKRDSYISVSYDEKEIVYGQILYDSKLVMIENLFK